MTNAPMVLNDALFRTLMDNISDGVYLLNTERRIQYWNRSAERITGYAAEEVLGKCCADDILVHVDEDGENLCKSRCPVSKTLEDGHEHTERLYLHHKEGHRVPVQVSVAPIRNEKGAIIGGLESFYDNSEMMGALQEIEELTQLSLLCPLTGVGNRRYTEQILVQRLDEAKRNGTRCAVMMIDVDHFKHINDAYGHHIGDITLKMVARTLAGAMRSYDFLGRWGGEEFLVVLPKVKRPSLEHMADRLRKLVEKSSREVSENKLSVTVSVGAALSRAADTVASVVKRADKLMYQSKTEGRNRVTCEA